MLDEAKTVRENVLEGIQSKKLLLENFNEIALKIGENYSEELMEEMTTLQDRIDSEGLWDLDSQVDVAMEALRCPHDEASILDLSEAKTPVALCKLLLECPDYCSWMSLLTI